MSDLRSFHVCIASLSGKRSCWDLDWLFKASQNHQALSCKYNLIFLTRLNSVGDWVKLHSGGSDVISCARLGGFRVECVSSSINSPTFIIHNKYISTLYLYTYIVYTCIIY